MYNWINPKEFSFNSFLLMDRWLLKMILSNHIDEFCTNMGIALASNKTVTWYFIHRCPECKDIVNQLIKKAPKSLSEDQIRSAEEYIIDYADWAIVYVYPEIMCMAISK